MREVVRATGTEGFVRHRHAEVGEQMARRILGRLRFSNDAVERICAIVANHMRFMDAQRMKASTCAMFSALICSVRPGPALTWQCRQVWLQV